MQVNGQNACVKPRAKKTASTKKPCLQCGKYFLAKQSQIVAGKGKFCSKKCGYLFRTKGKCVKCHRCGKEFFARPEQIQLGNGRYCSKSCGKGVAPIEKPCVWCGKVFLASQSESKKGKELYCSKTCKGAATSGPNSHLWRGGASFGLYCHKFNRRFKEQIRIAFQRTCFRCGVPENELRHDVHHIDYAKNSICNGKAWAFIPLCHPHHMATNSNRWYWFCLFINYWAMNPDIHFGANYDICTYYLEGNEYDKRRKDRRTR